MINLKKLTQVKYLSFILFLIITVLFIRNLLGPDIQTIYLDNNKVQTRCLSQPIENIKNNNYEEYKIEKIPQDLYISESIKNLYCYGFVGNIEIFEEEKVIATFYNSSIKIFQYLNIILNSVLIIIILYNLKFANYQTLFLFFLINYLNFDIFLPTVNKYYAFFPFLEINYYEISLFINSLFISIFLSSIKNNKFMLLSFIFHLIFLIDFLPIFLISIYFQNKYNFIFTNSERKIFISLPIFYYSVKIISSVTNNLDFLWLYTSQVAFRGLSRYPDLQLALFNLTCSKGKYFKFNNDENNIISCDLYTEGLFQFSLFTNLNDSEVVILTLIIFNSLLLLWMVLYLKIISLAKFDEFFVVVLSLSPPFIFLITQGNDDLVALVIGICCLYNLDNYTNLKLIVVTLISFLLIHSGIILFSILIIALLIKDRNIVLKSLIFNFIFAIFIFYNLVFSSISILNNQTYKNVFPDMGFGIILDTSFLSNITGINQFIVFLIFIVTLLFVYNLNYFKILYANIDIKSIQSVVFKKEYIYFLSIPIYFIFNFIFSNNSYRLPIFFVFFILIFTYSKSKVRLLLLFFLLFEPLIKSSPDIFRFATTFLSTISGYLILCITIKLLIDLSKSFKHYVE